MSTFSKFPAELVLHVFQFLPISSLHAMAQLSRDWRAFFLVNQSVIYHQAALLHQFIPDLNIPLAEAKKAYFGRSLDDETDWRGFCGFASLSYEFRHLASPQKAVIFSNFTETGLARGLQCSGCPLGPVHVYTVSKLTNKQAS